MAQALIGLFGIAVQNGLVLVTQTRSLTDRGKPFEEAVREASIGRVRPKIMTAATAILGLLPILVLRLHGTEIERPFGHCYDGRLDYVHHFYASCVADVLCCRSQVEQPLGDAAKLGTNDDSPQPQCCGIKGGGRFSLTNRGCLGRIRDAVFRCYWVILAVHRRYTLLSSFGVLRSLGERPGPCKY